MLLPSAFWQQHSIQHTALTTVKFYFRSVITSCLLIVWLPFGVVTDTVADICHILLKWNQYVREYENNSLRKVATEASSPFAQVDTTASDVHHHSLTEQSPQKLPPVTGELNMSAPQTMAGCSRIMFNVLGFGCPAVPQTYQTCLSEQPAQAKSHLPCLWREKTAKGVPPSRHRAAGVKDGDSYMCLQPFRHVHLTPCSVIAFGRNVAFQNSHSVTACTVLACALTQCTGAQALGSWLSAYTSMGVKAYKSEHGSRRPTKDDTLHTSHAAARHTTHHSNALFSWLFKACIAYQLYEWLWVSPIPAVFLKSGSACQMHCVMVPCSTCSCC